MNRLPMSRRTVLRGVGATLALPLLEAMEPLAAFASGAAGQADAPARPPLRLLFVFVPGGVNLDAWTPQGEGADYRQEKAYRQQIPNTPILFHDVLPRFRVSIASVDSCTCFARTLRSSRARDLST